MFEEILDFIECHDQAAYRKKIKGYRLAFNIRDKQYRIPESTLSKGIKQRNKESAEEIKQKVQEMKERRINEIKSKEQEEKNKQERNRIFFKRMHEKLRREKYGAEGIDIKNSYLGIKSKLNSGLNTLGGRQHAKVNLDVLQKMHYTDFNLGDEDDFKPTDIVDNDDDSEDSILEQFKNENEVKIPAEKLIMSKNEENQYDEKVTHIKHQIITNKNKTPKAKRDNSNKTKQDDLAKGGKTMLEQYRTGRNLSNAASK